MGAHALAPQRRDFFVITVLGARLARLQYVQMAGSESTKRRLLEGLQRSAWRVKGRWLKGCK